jgi:hypothetical protein
MCGEGHTTTQIISVLFLWIYYFPTFFWKGTKKLLHSQPPSRIKFRKNMHSRRTKLIFPSFTSLSSAAFVVPSQPTLVPDLRLSRGEDVDWWRQMMLWVVTIVPEGLHSEHGGYSLLRNVLDDKITWCQIQKYHDNLIDPNHNAVAQDAFYYAIWLTNSL